MLLQELNVKAETKFKKLKAQAKAKIGDLTREMEKLKEERGMGGGEGEANISALNVSVSCYRVEKLMLPGGIFQRVSKLASHLF